MRYKLIACDMDETLLNDNHLICEKNIKLIKKATQEYGVKFVPTTGRGYMFIQNILKELDLQDKSGEYVISFNGGALTENKNNKVLDFKGINLDKVKEIFEFGLKEDVGIQIYTQDKLYIYNLTEDERKRKEGQKIEYTILDDNNLDFLENEYIAKVLFQNTDVPYLMSLEPKMKHIIKNHCSVSYSSNRFMEFNAPNVNKGNGLINLAKILNIEMEEIIAIGDNYNDLSMLEVAGLSVAAGNAVEDVKKICDYTTKANNNEGVVSEVIEKFILNK